MNLEDELTPREIAQMREMAAAIWDVDINECWITKSDMPVIVFMGLSKNEFDGILEAKSIYLDRWINGERKVSMGLMQRYNGRPLLALSKCGRLWCDPRPQAQNGTECK